MSQKFRYGDFAREMAFDQHVISYCHLTPKLERDPEGGLVPYRPETLTLRPLDVHRLLTPYVTTRISEQLRAVLPLVLYLIVFQLFILRQHIGQALILTAGVASVIVGLMLFMEGLKLGLMPFAELIGAKLPRRSRLRVVLSIAFFLGIAVTLAEPAVGALQAAGAAVDPARAPLLFALLNQWSGALVAVIGVGVGVAAVLGTLRFLRGWSLKPLIYLATLPTLTLSAYMMTQPDLSVALGLAWDSGAITTGPVTVPIVLALGIGITAAAGKTSSALSGFGIVTLASLFPVLGVLALTIIVSIITTPEEILAAAQIGHAGSILWWETSPTVEILSGVRAIVPLVVFLYLVLAWIVREKLKDRLFVYTGLAFTLVGMIVFNLGLTYGLAQLGSQSGASVPGAFMALDNVRGSPLYDSDIGIFLALCFAFALGFGATLAEPALNALGLTVETLTSGALPRRLLIMAVSFGVGGGIMLGVVKVLYDIPLAHLLIPLYAAALVLTFFSNEEFVNVGWDSAGVTTGPVTVPLVLSMGLGFGGALRVVEGFGILAMASICPILVVLGTGLFIRYQARRQEQRKLQEEMEAAQL